MSRRITDKPSSTDVFGVVPYVDPRYLNNIKNPNPNQHYLLNPKSDVYSVGVLFWQISSGRRPFYAENVEYDVNLIMKIKEGRRENIVKDTPVKYSNLYKGEFIVIYYFFMCLNQQI